MSLEHRILVHDQLGRGQFAQHPGRGPKLDAMGADDLTIDRARYDDRRRLDFGGNHRVFADRHSVRAGDFTLEPTVDPRRPLEVELATHPGTLAQIIAVPRREPGRLGLTTQRCVRPKRTLMSAAEWRL
jgi:hypothetical protein